MHHFFQPIFCKKHQLAILYHPQYLSHIVTMLFYICVDCGKSKVGTSWRLPTTHLFKCRLLSAAGAAAGHGSLLLQLQSSASSCSRAGNGFAPTHLVSGCLQLTFLLPHAIMGNDAKGAGAWMGEQTNYRDNRQLEPVSMRLKVRAGQWAFMN